MTEKLFHDRPHTILDAEQAEAQLETFTQQRQGGGNQVYIVPVVFHVIHNFGEENISDEQIHSAMESVNIDFRKLNEDIDDVIEAFAGITADVEVEFRLAQLDPQGNCTNGITRTVSDLTYVGDSDMKELIQWPREKYLNVWVCAYAQGAAGYSLYPSSVNSFFNEDQDGIVLKHDYCGYIGTSNWSRRRTFPHEIGHWLNLRHCWGNSNEPNIDENCDEDDLVDDTPWTRGWQSCALYGESCGTLDNVQNYMEYSGCGRMFTEGQKDRMRAALESSTAQRNQLWQESNLEATGVLTGESILCEASFSVSKDVVCMGQEMQFFDNSYNAPSSWTWDFGDGTELSGNDPEIFKNPIHTYEVPGDYSITLVVSNGTDELAVTQEQFVTVLGSGELDSPLVEGFEAGFPDDEWFLYNTEGAGWEVTNTASFTGDYSLKLDNYSNDIEWLEDQFFSRTFDFSEVDEALITFKWAYASKTMEATSDRLRVYISADCGESWILKEQLSGSVDMPTSEYSSSPFTPSSTSEWASASVSITNPAQLTET
ncbi:MAG: PKD domain-containing protein, partial [Flavobacteriales bacterium]|nr:PKD domain-containing protein [Flavobacteriales bacterium]